MNILILTPDRVGSTLLQRVLTVYMTSTCTYDKPVINLHELSNGLMYYYSETFKQFVLGKDTSDKWGDKWGYHQNLPEIIEFLKKADHYKTSRLAHYHLKRRQDSITNQTKFYNYLNDNFYIIGCQRKNVFEYALSWGINASSKRLNVYTHQDKINIYSNLYKNRITISPQSFVDYLDAYDDYIKWSKMYFNINDFFLYEEHVSNIESFIHNLDLFADTKTTWKSVFGLSWNDWNKCHKLMSDVVFDENVKLLSNNSNNLPTISSITQSLPALDQKFLFKHSKTYIKSINNIQELVENKTLVTGIPIKLQTLAEKKMIIKNFNELINVYNDWASANHYTHINANDIITDVTTELSNWYNTPPTKFLLT